MDFATLEYAVKTDAETLFHDLNGNGKKNRISYILHPEADSTLVQKLTALAADQGPQRLLGFEQGWHPTTYLQIHPGNTISMLDPSGKLVTLARGPGWKTVLNPENTDFHKRFNADLVTEAGRGRPSTGGIKLRTIEDLLKIPKPIYGLMGSYYPDLLSRLQDVEHNGYTHWSGTEWHPLPPNGTLVTSANFHPDHYGPALKALSERFPEKILHAQSGTTSAYFFKDVTPGEIEEIVREVEVPLREVRAFVPPVGVIPFEPPAPKTVAPAETVKTAEPVDAAVAHAEQKMGALDHYEHLKKPDVIREVTLKTTGNKATIIPLKGLEAHEADFLSHIQATHPNATAVTNVGLRYIMIEGAEAGPIRELLGTLRITPGVAAAALQAGAANTLTTGGSATVTSEPPARPGVPEKVGIYDQHPDLRDNIHQEFHPAAELHPTVSLPHGQEGVFGASIAYDFPQENLAEITAHLEERFPQRVRRLGGGRHANLNRYSFVLEGVSNAEAIAAFNDLHITPPANHVAVPTTAAHGAAHNDTVRGEAATVRGAVPADDRTRAAVQTRLRQLMGDDDEPALGETAHEPHPTAHAKLTADRTLSPLRDIYHDLGDRLHAVEDYPVIGSTNRANGVFISTEGMHHAHVGDLIDRLTTRHGLALHPVQGGSGWVAEGNTRAELLKAIESVHVSPEGITSPIKIEADLHLPMASHLDDGPARPPRPAAASIPPVREDLTLVSALSERQLAAVEHATELVPNLDSRIAPKPKWFRRAPTQLAVDMGELTVDQRRAVGAFLVSHNYVDTPIKNLLTTSSITLNTPVAELQGMRDYIERYRRPALVPVARPVVPVAQPPVGAEAPRGPVAHWVDEVARIPDMEGRLTASGSHLSIDLRNLGAAERTAIGNFLDQNGYVTEGALPRDLLTAEQVTIPKNALKLAPRESLEHMREFIATTRQVEVSAGRMVVVAAAAETTAKKPGRLARFWDRLRTALASGHGGEVVDIDPVVAPPREATAATAEIVAKAETAVAKSEGALSKMGSVGKGLAVVGVAGTGLLGLGAMLRGERGASRATASMRGLEADYVDNSPPLSFMNTTANVGGIAMPGLNQQQQSENWAASLQDPTGPIVGRG